MDTHLKKHLQNLPDNVEVIYGSALKIIHKLKFNKIVSNIPYSISEPLFKRMIKIDFDMAVLLTGKRFFDLLLNKESKWSIISKLFFDVKKITEVSKESFEPKLRTNSVLLVFNKRKSKLMNSEKIIKEFVLQYDKKVKNALMYSLMRTNRLTKNQSKDVIYTLKLPPILFEKNVDSLSNGQFKIIYDKLQGL